MRFTPRNTCLITFALLATGLTWAQATAPAATATVPGTPAAIEQRIERIHVEDKAIAIDEVRVGGETRTIDVKPNNGMPVYQVSPADGQRSWKVLGF